MRAVFAEVYTGNRNHDTITMSMDDARRLAIRYTHMGLMNFRFRRRIDASEEKLYVRLPRERWREYDSPTNLDKIPWDKDHEGDDGSMDNQAGPCYPRPVPYQRYEEDEPDPYQDTEDQLPPPPAADDGPPPRTPPKDPEPGAQSASTTSPAIPVPLMQPTGMVLAFKSGSKGPRPNCFNHYSLDNHADISIFCNASLLTNIREHKAGLKVSGISNTSVNFTHVGDHPYCGTVIYAPNNRYNLIAMRVIRDNGHHYIVDKDNLFYAIMDKDDRMLVKFDYDPADHFYKVKAAHAFDFMDPNRKAKPPEEASIALNNAVIGAGDQQYDSVMYFSAEQRRRAALVPPIHIALNHLSDPALIEAVNSPSFMNCPISAEDVANARIIYGPCKHCMEGKPLPVKGSNPTLDKFDVIAPGQLLHVDIVFISKIPHLFSVDDYSGYMNLIRMATKRKESLEHALLALVLYYRSHLKVVRCISSDHEAVFLSCESFLWTHGATYRARIPGEHEVDAERGMRTIREAMLVKQLEIKEEYTLPEPFLPFLAMDCVNTRNFIPNSRSSPRMPAEIVENEKVNFRTHITAFYGQLVLTKSNNVSTTSGAPVLKQETGIALGRIPNTKGSVWLYRMGSNRIVPRRVIKAMPMTEEWRQHLNELASRKPIDPAHFFEFRSTLEYSPSDKEPEEERTVEERTEANTVINSQRSQPVPIVQPTVAELPVSLPASPRPVQQSPVSPVYSPPARADPSPPASPPGRRRISFGNPPAPRPEPQSPIPKLSEDTKVPFFEQKHDEAHGFGRGRRAPKPKAYAVSLKPDTAEDVKWLHLNNIVPSDQDDNMFVYMGAHEDDWDFTALQITLDVAVKTKYKAQVEASAVVECKNIVDFKTFKYLMRREDAEKSIHLNLLPCSMVVKDKRDSKGELLLWKSRLATGGHMTNPDTYQPFDKTSPTASMDSVYTVLAVMQNKRMNLEVCDVPSAYLNTPLPKGKKHVMRIKPLIAKYFVIADPSAKRYLQKDGSLIVQLEKALYGLPEAGKLWHELLRDCLTESGYKSKPNDTTVWRRVEKRDGRVVSISIVLVFVDDFLHVWKGPNGGNAVRDHLHTQLGKRGLPPLKCSRLTEANAISFLGLSIQLLPGFRLFVSQPGYTAALVETYDYARRQNSPLPPDFNSRKPTEDDLKPLDEDGITLYRKEIMSIAWLVRTRPNIATAVAHKQTKCSAPTAIDLEDLGYIIGFLANNLKAGIVIDCKDTQLYLYVDVGHATHPIDMRSHSGAIVSMGKLGTGGVPIVWKSLKQKVVSLHSTSAELIGLSDMFDLLQCANDLMSFICVPQEQPFTVYQDNTSTITIAYMGRSSSQAKRRFLEIRYFWFKEHLDAGFAKLEYLASEDHPADLLASVRSGAEFKHFSSMIMGTI